MTTVECIHGLELSECEVCSPREAPVAASRPPRSMSRSTPRAGGAAAAKPASVHSMAVRSADARRYLVLSIDELADELAGGPLGESEGWRIELAAPTSREQVVLVSALSDPDAIVLVGVANEPARRRVADALRSAGRSVRVVINPAWFA